MFVLFFIYLHVLLFTRSFANPLIYPFDYYFINQLVLCFIASQVHWSFMVCSLIRLFFLFVHSLIRPFFYPSINFSHGFIHPPQIFFFCPKEPGESCGGETPLARCSDIVSKLDSEVVKKFEVKGVMYVRHLPDKSRSDYMPWQHQFYTDDRKVIQLGSHQESHVRIDCTLKAKNKIVEI